MNDNNRYDDIKDVYWEKVDADSGKIKFINMNRRSTVRTLVKLCCFILVAAVSGGISGAYIANKKESTKIYTPDNQLLVESNNGNKKQEDTSESNIYTNSISKVAQTVGLSVVGISNKAEGYFGLQDVGSGSGIIVDSNGYIATNYHVIEGADKVTVRLSSGKILDASILGVNQQADLAVIKVDAKNLPVVKFGDSSAVKVGDIVIAVGNSLGQEFPSVTAGIISALNRKIEYNGTVYKVIQTDAATNPGNSGGALCNIKGYVIGINTLKIGSDSNVEGISFAININDAKNIIKSLMSYGEVSKPYLGIYGESVTSQNNNVQGVYIQQVEKDSGAAASGIKPTDILTEIDGKKVKSLSDIEGILQGHKVGDKVVGKIWRNGKIIEIEIVLSENKESE
ncbi:S1C family serine protease [Clostridium kluyveri]|uniref:Predicted serine protease n=2 Tax=Clostridium kluyveri TaxID=1534 RepID=A5N4I9_CLOK5|nr:trypsin-like peptidase domain-containing protein [Clostridium kluyveri]EDK32220.1 Predicted serine protease [Clostridium kluyveri DSM 555]